MTKLTCFKSYDVRGKLGEELDSDVAYRIGLAFAEYIQPKAVVVGGDVRATSEELKLALADGLMDAGVDVIDIGMVGTEEIYFATKHLQVDGGVEVTASHNPIDYNGMKFVRDDSKPISGDTGLKEIQLLAEKNDFSIMPENEKGKLKKQSILKEYINHLLTYIDTKELQPMKIVVNSGNGAAGHVIDEIEARFDATNIPVEFVKVFHEPDATFPNGIPNPILLENRKTTSDAVLKHNADLGIAWDGDFDRCFFFDANGEFIEGYYIVGLLAESFLKKSAGEKIIYDPRLTWNTIEIVTKSNGIPVMSKTGHAFIKERMRKENAVYGGEMSAHHYFRDFAYCDSGMIPWLLIVELMSKQRKTLSSMVEERIRLFPSSGEINSKLEQPQEAIQRVLNAYEAEAVNIDHTDGIALEFAEWRFNLRSSNTEPVVRLNVESRADIELMNRKTAEILNILQLK